MSLAAVITFLTTSTNYIIVILKPKQIVRESLVCGISSVLVRGLIMGIGVQQQYAARKGKNEENMAGNRINTNTVIKFRNNILQFTFVLLFDYLKQLKVTVLVLP